MQLSVSIRPVAIASVLSFALLLTACGQKGPLYLPDDKAAAERYGIPEQTQKAADDVADPPEQQTTEPPANDNERDS